MTVERYDELQKQSEELKKSIANAFRRTHAQHQVFAKVKLKDEESSSNVKFKCNKCGINFSSLAEVTSHKHNDESPRARRQSARSVKEGTNVKQNARITIESLKASSVFKKNITITPTLPAPVDENIISLDSSEPEEANVSDDDFHDPDFRDDPESSEDEVLKPKINKKKGSLECPTCGCTFRTEKYYREHVNKHKPRDKSLFCAECSKYLKTPAGLQLHNATDHGRIRGPVDCPVCFKNCQDREALRSHFNTHALKRTILCGM